MPLQLPDYLPNQILALRLEYPVHTEVGDFSHRTPDRFSRSQEARNLFRKFIREQEWTVREHSKRYFSRSEAIAESTEPVHPVWFIETPDSPWLVIAGWPFPEPLTTKLSQLLNTVTVGFSLRHAYRNNWTATIAMGGHVVGTFLKHEYMKFLGIPIEAFPLFERWSDNLEVVFGLQQTEIDTLFRKALDVPNDEHGSDMVEVGTLMSELGIWKKGWRDYLSSNFSAMPSEIHLILK